LRIRSVIASCSMRRRAVFLLSSFPPWWRAFRAAPCKLRSSMPAVSPRWDTTPCDDAAADQLAAALNVPPVVARLLCQRGLSDPELAARFLNPSLDQLHDPMALKDMRAAVDRILAAIARKERIAIHGDYDVDGVTSTVILRRSLELLGA